MPLLFVKEVLAMPKVTPMPASAAYFVGITNLRGQVISIIDLRTKLGIKPSDGNETAVILCDFGSVCLGVVVDSIDAVITPKEGEISGAPDMLGHSRKVDYISGVYRQGDRLVMLLDVSKSLNVEDLKTINNSLGAKSAA